MKKASANVKGCPGLLTGLRHVDCDTLIVAGGSVECIHVLEGRTDISKVRRVRKHVVDQEFAAKCHDKGPGTRCAPRGKKAVGF